MRIWIVHNVDKQKEREYIEKLRKSKSVLCKLLRFAILFLDTITTLK